MTRKATLLACLLDYRIRFPDEATSVDRAIAAFQGSADPFSRRNLPGHVTASGIVLNVENGGIAAGQGQGDAAQVLLVWHAPTARWLQPGGHVEGDETPDQSALREVMEETGFRCGLHAWHRDPVVPIDVDIHRIPANPSKHEPEHWHCDLRFVLVPEGPAGTPLDAHAMVWRPLADIDAPGLSRIRDKLRRMV
ncbi:8-oxo-dGTP pyrophosphatase MutT, NUDIX family [Chitinasiproducens palmae]|uniref:8-oxo-dGTP pyrophosphatase MutT, NUDIX family n=2 Tax=Chitinasiproducens palmae TaxID=1770053 RepID=A0A1H2PLX5_9BURK|nr:8-oxo-dGTP pyrophosphatase MutT, NUDIX family [Chitinasiproducens palmae]